jgi:hypothetical protein
LRASIGYAGGDVRSHFQAALPIASLALAMLLAASALAQSSLRVVDLGDGMRAELVPRSIGFCPYGGGCALWQVSGLDIGALDALLIARAFVRVPDSPRILASLPRMPAWTLPSWRPWARPRVVYTDDRGRTWHEARWPSLNVPEAFAFSADGHWGASVGPSQSVWTTEDRGASWTERASGAGYGYEDVAVLGRALVMVDERRVAWRSRDRGFSRLEAAREVSDRLRIEADAIVVPTARGVVRVDGEGRVRP